MPETQDRTTPGAGGNGAADHRGIGERVGSISENAQHLWSEAQGAVHDIGQTLDLRGRVERHPYGMMLAALGVGYLLGGGLFSRLTGSLVRMGIRVAALPLVKEELLRMAKDVMGGAGEESAPGEPPKQV